METCGVIYVSNDYEKFLMRCSFCPKDVEMAQWQQFVLHFRNMHTPQENEKYEQANHDDDLDLAEKSAAEEAQEINLATRDEHINLELEIETVQSLLSEAEESGVLIRKMNWNLARSKNQVTNLPMMLTF